MDIPSSQLNKDLSDVADVYVNLPPSQKNKKWPDSVNDKNIRRAPNCGSPYEQLWLFLQQPVEPLGVMIPAPIENNARYIKRNNWNADIHLIGTYVFLSNDERQLFAASEHKYLIKNVYEHEYINLFGASTIDVLARNMVSSFILRFRRSDVYLRNEWLNYTNWSWSNEIPYDLDYNFK